MGSRNNTRHRANQPECGQRDQKDQPQGVRESIEKRLQVHRRGLAATYLLTVCFVIGKNARQPLREQRTPSVVCLHLLRKQGAANVLAKYHRPCAVCQYSLVAFLRPTRASYQARGPPSKIKGESA